MLHRYSLLTSKVHTDPEVICCSGCKNLPVIRRARSLSDAIHWLKCWVIKSLGVLAESLLAFGNTMQDKSLMNRSKSFIVSITVSLPKQAIHLFLHQAASFSFGFHIHINRSFRAGFVSHISIKVVWQVGYPSPFIRFRHTYSLMAGQSNAFACATWWAYSNAPDRERFSTWPYYHCPLPFKCSPSTAWRLRSRLILFRPSLNWWIYEGWLGLHSTVCMNWRKDERMSDTCVE